MLFKPKPSTRENLHQLILIDFQLVCMKLARNAKFQNRPVKRQVVQGEVLEIADKAKQVGC